MSSVSPAQRQIEKQEKKKRKREAEEQPARATADSDEDEERVAKKNRKNKEKKEKKIKKDKKEKKEKKKAKKEKKEKKDKKEKKGKKKRQEADSSDEDGDDAVSEREKEKKAKKEKKKAKKEKKEKKAAAKKRARDAEVLEAGERALQEERDEADAEAKAKAAAEQHGDGEAAHSQKRHKHEEKDGEAASTSDAADSSSAAAAGQPKVWPAPPPGNVTLLLFYQYVRPSWTPSASRNAENFARDSLTQHGCTGRLRCAREGFNGTLTGSASGIRAFCEDLRAYDPALFGSTDFKLVDGLRDNQRLKGLKVWHVEELVTYGFGPATATKGVAPIEAGGTHLPPAEWHAKAAEPGTVLIDVRNANENAIGRFQPLGDASRVLDPNMRTSTEFPEWVDEALPKLQEAKQVLMYCTGGIRCERASALLVQKGLDASKVFQLEGGIHRYLEAFPTGGHWIGKNYTFDRRFAHGAVDAPPEAQVPVGRCCLCTAPWDRYQAHKKCALCRMEVLLCRECERGGKYKGQTLKCHLCGGPKPSYLPPDDNTFKPKKPKSYYNAKASAEGDY